jgi:hypothetical protein
MDWLPVVKARRAESAGSHVEIRGWVRTRRDSKGGFSFLEINDGSCLGNLQVVVPASLSNYTTDVLRLSVGASAIVRGELKASPGKGQSTELAATEVVVLGLADPATYPLQKKGASLEFLRTIAHLRPRLALSPESATKSAPAFMLSFRNVDSCTSTHPLLQPAIAKVPGRCSVSPRLTRTNHHDSPTARSIIPKISLGNKRI